MKKTTEPGAKRPAARVILVTAVIVIGFGLTGCSKQMAKIQDQQLQLQATVEANTEQIAAIAARIEQNQNALQAELQDLSGSIRQAAAQTAAVGETTGRLTAEQVNMQQAMQDGTRQMTSKMAAIEQSLGRVAENQHGLQTGIRSVQTGMRSVQTGIQSAQAGIESVQTGIQGVQADGQRAVSDMTASIAAVADGQAKLYETVQNNSRQLADNAAAIKQSSGLFTEDRQQWAAAIEKLQGNIQQVTATMNTLGENVSKLQQSLQENVDQLVSMMDAASQSTGRLAAEQVKFRDKTQANLRALDGSLNAIRQSLGVLTENQNKLQTQLKDVQNSAEGLRNVPAALTKFADELARMGIRERAEVMDPKPSASRPPAETNGVE
jgi:chromosome segregation ATPase